MGVNVHKQPPTYIPQTIHTPHTPDTYTPHRHIHTPQTHAFTHLHVHTPIHIPHMHLHTHTDTTQLNTQPTWHGAPNTPYTDMHVQKHDRKDKRLKYSDLLVFKEIQILEKYEVGPMTPNTSPCVESMDCLGGSVFVLCPCWATAGQLVNLCASSSSTVFWG